MSNFDSGVYGYITGVCEIKVHFPIDKKGFADIACKNCPYLSGNDRMCQLNKKPVVFPNSYVGADCPLKKESEE